GGAMSVQNSTSGLFMLQPSVSVAATDEQHHQRALAKYPVVPGGRRWVAAELGWCTIDTGKYRGRRAVEVRLDGERVGRLSYLMSQRYARILRTVVDAGRRPGCQATVVAGSPGLELELRLPRPTAAVIIAPIDVGPAFDAGLSMRSKRFGVFARHPIAWGAGGAAAALVIVLSVMAGQGKSSASTTDPALSITATSTSVTSGSASPKRVSITTRTAIGSASAAPNAAGRAGSTDTTDSTAGAPRRAVVQTTHRTSNRAASRRSSKPQYSPKPQPKPHASRCDPMTARGCRTPPISATLAARATSQYSRRIRLGLSAH
ncbi:MAG: hypothetical protein J2O49_12005, partial [Sciscionella sp.]|nr:hypothetical protein [Sciscionella sp.]